MPELLSLIHISDKFGAGKVTQMGAALVTLSFALMFMLPLLPVHDQLAPVSYTHLDVYKRQR